MFFTFITFSLLLFISGSLQIAEDQTYWKNLGNSELKAALTKRIFETPAKNIILFVGDGMGPTTVTVSRIHGETEKGYLAFEKFSNIGVLKTYSANKLVPDSCSTATALFSGVKANQKTSGVDASVGLNDCQASLVPSAQLPTVVTWAQEAGKSTGFVTTSRVTHATPSALYAHTPNRKWECESVMPPTAKHCKDIARQLIEELPGRNLQVIMGGGRQCLQSKTENSSSDPLDTWACNSNDGRDLITDWIKDKTNRAVSQKVLMNSQDLKELNLETEFVLGVFANGHLAMEYLRDKTPKGMPSLTDMTQKAIEVLQKNPKGFFLMVEGGMIDFGHHRGHAKQAVEETLEFSRAVQKALDITNEEETLIIVTADHAHSLVFGGYPDRGSDIFETLEKSAVTDEWYTPLLYGTGGPNNYKYSVRNDGNIFWGNPREDQRTNYDYSQQSAVLTDEVTHSGTDVLVYANGPMAHLFNSVHEQTYVAYVISYAARIGQYSEINSQIAIKGSLLTVLGFVGLLRRILN